MPAAMLAGIDCGYIYPDGEFKKAPGSYRCPVCNSPKSRCVPWFWPGGNSSAVTADKCNFDVAHVGDEAALWLTGSILSHGMEKT
jgi:hypothetical protein